MPSKRKKGDKRGKHTKETRLKRQAENKRFFDSISVLPSCRECNGIDFVPTTEGDSHVCTGCGCVGTARIIDGCTDVLLDFHGSAPYKHRNYLAERIQQARNREPRFTTSEANKISVVWSALHDRDGDTWSNDPRSFSKYRFRQLLRILNELEPDRRWKQKLEKWWQAREILYGVDDSWHQLDDYHSFMIKILFDPFACYFALHFKKAEPGTHNIPKMDLIILVLLYNISPEALMTYGWYFLSKNIVWPTKSTEIDHQRIQEIADKVNEEFVQRSKKPDVRQQSYAWLHKNHYTVPDLDLLAYLAMESPEGKIVYNQLVSYEDPIRNISFFLDD